MQSMTGFGQSSKKTKTWIYFIQVRSVNSRFLDVKPHLPSFLNNQESYVRQKCGEFFSRGSLDIYVKAEYSSLGLSKKPVLNRPVISHYLKQFSLVEKELSFSSPQQTLFSNLLSLPEVIKFETPNELDSQDLSLFRKSLDQAFMACKKERTREGERLKEDLKKILIALGRELKKIKTENKKFNHTPPSSYVERIRSSLEKKNLELNEERLYEEWAYFKERAAIFEEIERLETHFSHCEKLMEEKSSPIGKRLDFYTQELLREFNTIGSKTNQASITQSVVEAKSLIERFKEQVQNIE